MSSETDGTLTITVTESTSSDDANSLGNYMSGKSFKQIVFTGDGKVTNEFVSKLNNYVSNVTILNMGGVTIDELSSSSIPTGLDFTKVTELTVPKTKVVDEKMTFPKDVFNASESNHPYEWTSNQEAITKLIFPEGYTDIADEAFPDSYGFKWIQALGLPTTLKTIGKKAFINKSSLTEVTFPDNLDKIDDAAFAQTSLKKLKFNKKLRFIGNSAFLYSNQTTEETLIIPASVKYIGPSAFYNRQYQEVYFQGDKAPIMPCGASVANTALTAFGNTAFPSNTLMGNNGFTPNGGKSTHDNAEEGWANRDNYINKDYYYCVLHYPTNLSEENENTYVDVTRKYITQTTGTFNKGATYTIGEETTSLTKVEAYEALKAVAYGYKDTYLGDQYIWPSMDQAQRAFVTAANGVCWNGVGTYLPPLAEEDKAIYAEAGYVIGTGTGQYTEEELRKMAHMGTRMFVLANADSQSGDNYTPNIKKDGTWWTLCVPFNMTKKQVFKAFGSKTQLYLFSSVTREIDVNNRNHILIRFATNPMTHNTAYTSGDNAGKKAKFETTENADKENGHEAGEWDYQTINTNTNVGDDDIVIWAHESYMIKPSDGENSDQEATSIVIGNYEPVPGNPQPSVVRAKTITKTQDDSDYNNCYRFIGNYISGVKMPQYCYFYGTTNADKNEKFRFLTGTNSTWKTNGSIIEAHAHDGGVEDYENFFGGNTENTTNEAKVMQTTLFGSDEGDSTTGIDDVKIVIGTDTLTPIFSLDGKLASASGDTTGLAKGIYVKAGKKFVVK